MKNRLPRSNCRSVDSLADFCFNVHVQKLLILFILIFLSTLANAQGPTPTPAETVVLGTGEGSAPKVDPGTKPGETKVMRLTKPTLAEEFAGGGEIEPKLKGFQMNLRFMHASFSRPAVETLTGYQYQWDYFPEATIIVKFYETSRGSYPADAQERKKQVSREVETSMASLPVKKTSEKDIVIGSEFAKEFEFSTDDQTVISRQFVHNGVWYSLLAQPKTNDARALIEKVLDSFTFVKE
jgi:hypothetical protein